ncbi:B4 protein, partial [Polyodon spathula]|nr:B4 protein [Polyodon spathula]
MVTEALKELDTRKGTSVPAIRSYILAKYPTVDPARLKPLLRNALTKGIDNGTLARPVNSIATGATGRFKWQLSAVVPNVAQQVGLRLVVKKVIKKNKEAKAEENADPNVQEAPKTDKVAPKKTKPKAAKIKDAEAGPKPKKERATKPKAAVKEESADEGKGDSGEEVPATLPKNTNKRAKKGKVAE